MRLFRWFVPVLYLGACMVCKAQTDTLPTPLRLRAEKDARQYKTQLSNRRYLTIVDYSRSIRAVRLWVYDTEKKTVVLSSRVSHAYNSGLDKPTDFSDAPGSEKSSLGPYRTAEAYTGRFGYSLRLDGLASTNRHARARAIVVHPDPGCTYSLGCFMLPPVVNRTIIDLIKGGSLLCAYK